MKVLFGLAGVLVVSGLVAIVFQEWRCFRTRRDLAGDRQSLFHVGSVLHILRLLKLAPGQKLLDGVRHFVDSMEKNGAQLAYASKTFINGRRSRKLPPEDWEVLLVTQYPDRRPAATPRALEPENSTWIGDSRGRLTGDLGT